LRAPFNPELAVDVAGVGLHCVQGDKQLIADFLVRAALGNEFQNGQFTGAELFAGL
jgi:hypothetical protein